MTIEIDYKDKAHQLAYKKAFRGMAAFPEPFNASWEQLHEMRKTLTKEMGDLIERVEKEHRDMHEAEDVAWNYGNEVIGLIQREFKARESMGTREPIQYPKAPPISFTEPEQRVIAPVSRSYRGLFKGNETASLDKADFRSLDDFCEQVASGRHSRELEKRTFLGGSGSAGGFSVPEVWTADIFDASLESEIVRPLCSLYPMTSDTLHIPAWDSKTHTSGLFGGFTASFIGENSDASVQTGALRSMTLTAKKMGIYTEASREAVADGLSLGQQIGDKLAKACAFYLDYHLLTGNGVAKPLGVINAPATIGYNRATANQIGYSDIVGMWSRLAPSCMPNAVWLASYQTITQMANIRDTGNNNVWIQQAAAQVPATLFGRPVIFTEKLPALGTKGDLILVDLSQYALGMRQEIVLETSNAPGWTRDVMSFRAILRFDGQPLWDEPVSPIGGGATVSFAVALDVP